MSTHNLFFSKIRKIMYTHVNPSFTIQKLGLMRVFVMKYDSKLVTYLNT